MILSKENRHSKKKFILVVGLFLLCLVFYSTRIVDINAAGEYVLTASDVTYSDNGDGTITITGYGMPLETDIVIPNTIAGKTVTSIGDGAFWFKRLTSIVISDSVTTIGDFAFYLNDITSVVIPDSVITIGDYAFTDNRLTSVVIPDSVTTIGDVAFGFNDITSVVIPNSVTTIGDYAFKFNQLTSVVIPNSVTTIGFSAFDLNYELQPIMLPASDGELWVNKDGVLVTEIVDFLNNYTKNNVSFIINGNNSDIEIESTYEYPTYTAYINSPNGQTIDISDSVMIFGYINTDFPGTYELVYRLLYEGYIEEHKVEVRVIDTRPPKYYRLQDQLVYIDTDLDWAKLIGRIWSSSEVSINVIGNVNSKKVGVNKLNITIEDSYDNKVDDNVKIYVSNNRDDFTKLTYRLNNNKRMEYDIKKEAGYYDHYKLNVEYLYNNVDLENVGNYVVVVRTYSVLRSVRIETFLVEIIE